MSPGLTATQGGTKHWKSGVRGREHDVLIREDLIGYWGSTDGRPCRCDQYCLRLECDADPPQTRRHKNSSLGKIMLVSLET